MLSGSLRESDGRWSALQHSLHRFEGPQITVTGWSVLAGALSPARCATGAWAGAGAVLLGPEELPSGKVQRTWAAPL